MLSAALMMLPAFLELLSLASFVSGVPQQLPTSSVDQSSSTLSSLSTPSSSTSNTVPSVSLSSVLPLSQPSFIPPGICTIILPTMDATSTTTASSEHVISSTFMPTLDAVPIKTASSDPVTFSTSTPTKRSFFERDTCQCGCATGDNSSSVGLNGNSSNGGNSSDSFTSFLNGPKFGIYSDTPVNVNGTSGIPPLNDLQGYNVLYLAFLLYDQNQGLKPFDQAAVWGQMDNATRKSIKMQYNDAGVKIMASAFGDTMQPTTSNFDPVQVANDMADWVLANDLDGIDIDYEDMPAMSGHCVAETWLVKFTIALRQRLPREQGYFISHAPVAPWFSPNNSMLASSASGAYLAVDFYVGPLIDWYNVQFYNQGDDYETCNTLVVQSHPNSFSEKSSLGEILQLNNISSNKIVLTKPLQSDDANGGWMTSSLLSQCVQQANHNFNWTGGISFWQYQQDGTDTNSSNNSSAGKLIVPSEAMKTIRSSVFPMSSN